nr:hypothetical transcript [Hymenolepis microstoma]
MSVVETIFDWVLQCINGGLLNVLFTAERTNTPGEYNYKFEFNSQKLLSYAKGTLLLKGEDLPLEILETFPENIGGGKSGVKEAQANPNREAYFIFGAVGVALIMLIAIIGLLFISCCTCNTKNGTKKKKNGGNHRREERKDRWGNSQEGAGAVGQQEDDTVEGDGHAYYESESDSEVDPDFQLNELDYDADGNPKGFKENLRGLFLFYNSSPFGNKVEEKQAVILDKMEVLLDKNSFTRKHQGHICCGCHLLSLILDVIYIIGLLICIVVYIMAARQLAEVMGRPPEDNTTIKAEVIEWTSGKSTHFNLPGTVSFILSEAVDLLDDSVNGLLAKMNSTVVGLPTSLEPTIREGLKEIFELLRQLIEINKLFTETKKMEVQLIPELDKLNTEFKDIHTEVEKQQPGLQDLDLINFDFIKANVKLVAGTGIMILITIAFFVCLMLFIVEACRFRLFSCNGEGPSELASIEKLRQRSRACGGCRFCMCSFLLIFVIILAILAAVILVISSFLAAELCPYVWDEKGINQSDCVLNSFVNQQWPPVSNELLDIPAPNNVLYAIRTTCDPTQSTDPKLLPSIGVNRIANLTKLSEDPTVTEKFTTMSKDMADQISTSIDPKILTSIEEFRKMKAFLEGILQAVGADKAVVELTKFTDVQIEKLWDLQRRVTDKTLATKLAAEINELEKLMPNVAKVKGGYEGLDAQKQLPTELENYLDIVKAILEKMKDKPNLEGIMEDKVAPELHQLLTKLLNQGDASVNSIPEEILSCSSIHYVATSLIATGCSNSGLNNRFFGWALALILTVLFIVDCLKLLSRAKWHRNY